MNCGKAVGGAVVALVCWGLGYFVTSILVRGTGAETAYGLLVGWWLAAYVSSRVGLPLMSVVPMFVTYVVVFLSASLTGHDWFYRDAGSLSVWHGVVVGIGQAVVLASPLLFDWSFRRLQATLSRRTPEAD